MKNINNNFNPQEIESSTLKDYILLIRNNLITFLLILIVVASAACVLCAAFTGYLCVEQCG